MAKETIIWREWFNESAVEQLTKMGTLPREETEIDTLYLSREEIAEAVIEKAYREDYTSFQHGGEIVIIEPKEYAGTYNVEVEFEPRFFATECDPVSP